MVLLVAWETVRMQMGKPVTRKPAMVLECCGIAWGWSPWRGAGEVGGMFLAHQPPFGCTRHTPV